MNNDNKNLNTEPATEILSMEPPKRSWWKYALGAIGLIILIVGGYIGWKIYDFESGVRKVQQTAEFLKKLEEDDYKAAMADTYGGKTPQETLQMYIDAVEKRDYELASKYFIGGKQEEELRNLKDATGNSGINKYISYLNNDLMSTGEYSDDKSTYSIHNPVLVSFKRYPNGIWKIIEI